MLTVPVERIEQRARQVNAGRALKTALIFVPFAIGWTARKAWLGLTFGWTAIAAGWAEAGQPKPNAQQGRP